MAPNSWEPDSSPPSSDPASDRHEPKRDDETQDLSAEPPQEELDFDDPDFDDESEELRYEGPITIDDDVYGADYATGSGGRGLILAALMAVAVILMLGWALYSRSPAEPLVADEPMEIVQQRETFPPLDDDEEIDEGLVADQPDEIRADEEIAEDRSFAAAADSASIREVPRPKPESRPATVPRQEQPAPTPQAAPQRPAANLPAPPASGSLSSIRGLIGQGRLDQAARESRGWANTVASGRWTLQVMFACEPSTVSRAFDAVPDAELMVFPAVSQNRSCYRLTWGTFADRASAIDSAVAAPGYFTKNDRPRPIQLDRAAGL